MAEKPFAFILIREGPQGGWVCTIRCENLYYYGWGTRRNKALAWALKRAFLEDNENHIHHSDEAEG